MKVTTSSSTPNPAGFGLLESQLEMRLSVLEKVFDFELRLLRNRLMFWVGRGIISKPELGGRGWNQFYILR